MNAGETIIRNARLPGQAEIVDIAIEGEKFAAISPTIAGSSGASEIDASGLIVMPGFIDPHVHFNEPGREDWEGLTSGPVALSMGGGTCFIDMPLNSHPPVLDSATLEVKRRIAEKKSVLDFSLWGGLCPGHLAGLAPMADAGAIGFKAFLSPSGIDEFPNADRDTLREGMRIAADLGLPVGVHAEDPVILEAAGAGVRGKSMRDFLASRPIGAEVSSIRMACETAATTGCALYVVHVSSAAGLGVIAEARAAGIDVTAETCPHYLLLDEDDAVRLGAAAKCAPPLRPGPEVGRLWERLLSRGVDTIGSDHSPSPPGMKTGEDFFAIWGGIGGCQHAAPLFLEELLRRDPSTADLAARLLSSNTARRFRFDGSKGSISVGKDADLLLLRIDAPRTLAREELLTRHAISPYLGRTTRLRVERVLRRGETIVKDGLPVAGASRGIFLRPA